MKNYVIKAFTPKDKPNNSFWEGTRYAIYDKETGELIDDAQGYGYRTMAGAHKCLWYKENREKLKVQKQEAIDVIRKYKNVFRDNKWIFCDIDIDDKEAIEIFWKNVKEESEELAKILTKELEKNIVRVLTDDKLFKKL